MAKLIVALDVPDAARALAIARQMRGLDIWLKIGLELFTACGPDMARQLRDLGFKIFFDLKFYDIPNTVARAVAAAAPLADMLTLHLQGGQRMCQAAREAADACNGRRPLLAGVTALTSFAPGEMPGIQAAPTDYGLELASLAVGYGVDAVVCSGLEAEAIGRAAPGLLRICPGIRPASAGAGDQRRIMTPGAAVKAGADFLVAGRPIAGAPDPLAAARAILAEMAAAG